MINNKRGRYDCEYCPTATSLGRKVHKNVCSTYLTTMVTKTKKTGRDSLLKTRISCSSTSFADQSSLVKMIQFLLCSWLKSLFCRLLRYQQMDMIWNLLFIDCSNKKISYAYIPFNWQSSAWPCGCPHHHHWRHHILLWYFSSPLKVQ